MIFSLLSHFLVKIEPMTFMVLTCWTKHQKCLCSLFNSCNLLSPLYIETTQRSIMSNIKISKATKLMGFLFYLPVAFDNIDLLLLNPNFTDLIITGLNVYIYFLSLALLPSLCTFRFLFWDWVHLLSSLCKDSQIGISSFHFQLLADSSTRISLYLKLNKSTFIVL